MAPTKLPCGHLVMQADVIYTGDGRQDMFLCGDCGQTYRKDKFGFKLRPNDFGAPSAAIDPEEAKRLRNQEQDERLRSQMIEGLMRLKRLADE